MGHRHTPGRAAVVAGARIAAIVAVVGATAGTALPASASADGCTHPQSFSVGACIRVVGAGLYVQSIQGGAYLLPRQSVRGHFEIHYGNVIKDGPNEVYWNQSYLVRQGVYGTTLPINQTLGQGTQVCSYFWVYNGGVNYSGPYGPACITVHS
jgi:hypothetical protein